MQKGKTTWRVPEDWEKYEESENYSWLIV